MTKSARRPVITDFKMLPTDNVSGIPAGWLAMVTEVEAGASYVATAEKHGIPVGTVKSRINRTRSRIVAQRVVTEPDGEA